jgi:L-aminopeptidase/D-esterase-like protein
MPASDESASVPAMPEGVAVGHWSDREAWTGCTVVLPPEGSVASCEVRGGGPGTRETDVLSPAAAPPSVHGLVLTGGSAFGLAAADGVVRWLAERDRGHETSVATVPLVPAAVVFDPPLGDAGAAPDPDAGYAACEAASEGVPERGSVGAGTGCAVGKLLGPEAWTKGGLGFASTRLGEVTIAAIAAVNAAGDVIAADGSVAAGVWRDGGYVRTTDLMLQGVEPRRAWRESTTLAYVITDAELTKTEAWLVARAATSGVARAVDPSATAVDGDAVFCVATGRARAEPFVVASIAAHVTAGAIRDGVRQATGAPGCPSAAERGG